MFNNTFSPRNVARAIIVALVLVLGLGAPVKAQAGFPAEGEIPRFEEVACATLASSLLQVEDVTCGYLVVPQVHQDPTGATLRLGVAILARRAPDGDASADAIPLVIAHGGPGGSALETYPLVLANSPLREARDIVLFDQRGSRYTEPALLCPEILDATVATMQKDLPLEEELQQDVEVSLACNQRLHSEEGHNLSAFNSLENAADVDDLRVALGYEQINLYGISYGSLLTFHVLRDYAGGLHSIIVDGVVPPQVNFLTEIPVSIERAFDALFTACAAAPACAKAYPDLERVFFDTVARLNQTPDTISLMDRETGKTYEAVLDGDWVQSALFEMLYLTELIPALPRTIYDIAAGDYNLLSDIQGLLIFDRAMSYGAYFSILCAEDANYTEKDIATAGVDPRILRLEVRDVASVLDVCTAWHTVALGEKMDAPVVSDVPALLLSGAFDPITPPRFAEVAAETLSRSYTFTFPNGGHGALASGACQDQIIADFLKDPTVAPDSACIAASAPMFYTPENTLVFPVIMPLLNMDAQAWLGVGVFVLGVLVLLSIFLVYPLVWLFKALRRQRPSLSAMPGTGDDETASPAGPEPPLAYGLWPRLTPWLAMGHGLLCVIFAGGLVAIVVKMVLANEMRIYFGVAASWWPLFVVPLVIVLLTVLMAVACLRAWQVKAGSVWRRLYETILVLAAGVTLLPLTLSGALSVFW
jgi:pimeloyl-ACP methyl ester carboxylesterase